MVELISASSAAGWGWRSDLRRSVVRICGPSRQVAGTGFVVGDRLVVTCAHVVDVDGMPPGELVSVEFPYADRAVQAARVDAACWRGPDREDVAFLRCDRPLPESVRPLPVGVAEGAYGHRMASFGFPANAPDDGHYGHGRVGGELRSDTGSRLVQVTECSEVTEGFSGGPGLDEITGLVIGMVDSVATVDRLGRGSTTAYATPTETLRAICPQLAWTARFGLWSPGHIIRNDPASVLADVAAKRATVDRCAAYLDGYMGDDWSGTQLAEDTLRDLAVPFAHHQDYREEWRPRG